jgi:hypothetical protein
MVLVFALGASQPSTSSLRVADGLAGLALAQARPAQSPLRTSRSCCKASLEPHQSCSHSRSPSARMPSLVALTGYGPSSTVAGTGSDHLTSRAK